MIEINNLTKNEIDEKFLKEVINQVLKEEKIKQEVELSVALIGPGRMRKLNKQYLGRNRVADVLAFPESKLSLEKFKIGPLAKIRGLGEIVICPREAKKNVKRMNSTFEKEIATYLIHGLLHLLGYEHEKNEKEAKKMEEKQEYYLSLIKSEF